MNKQAYRVIFNVRRGALMAVAENVSSQGKSTSESSGASAPAAPAQRGGMRFAQLGLMIAVLFGGVTVVQAQIVADRNAASRPVVDQSANGKPVVQIVTPNAAGVSHNRYDQFNVGQGGAILNNSSTLTQTQQAGYIAGNAALVNGSARLILNEVTGASRSQLNGYIEVAGQRAEVIVANPNGISCSGCGFINTSRGVLTTGTPEFAADGSLANLRVTRGNITIDGSGLNGAGIDRVDLIARSVQVNGQLWGDQLNVVTGANLVNYANLGVQVIQGQGSAPTVSIDLAQLGGMYANKIKLVGTEAGVGVRSLGAIAAQAGDISIDNNGKVTLNGSTSASGNIAINSQGDVSNSGNLYAQQALQVNATGSVSNTGVLAAQTDVTVRAQDIASSNSIAAGVDASGNSVGNGNLSLNAVGSVDNSNGSLYAKDTLTVRAGADLTNANGVISSGNSVDLASTGVLTNVGGRIEASGSNAALTLAAASLDNNGGRIANSGTGLTQIEGGTQIVNGNAAQVANGGVIGGNGNVQLRALAMNNNLGGQINVGTDLSLQFATLSNTGDISATRDLSIAVTNGFANTGTGTLNAVRNLSLTADSVNNQGLINSGATTVVRAATTLNNTGRIYTTSKGFMASYASRSQRNNDSTSNVGSTLSGDSVQVQVGNNLNVVGSNIVGTKDVTLTASNDINITASQDVDQRYFKSIETKSGLMSGNNSVSVGKQTKGLEQTETSVVHNLSTIGSATGNVSIQAGRDVSLIGTQLQADKNVSISGRNVDIKAVVDTLDTRTLSYTESTGIRLGAKSNVTDAAMAIRAATSRGQEVNDPRLKALYAAKAAYAVKDLAQIIETAQKSQSGSGGLSGRVSIGIGTTREESLSVTHVDTVQKSQVAAGGDLNITARGDATPDQGDIHLKGSSLAGDNITLDAKRDLISESQQAVSHTEDSYRRLDAEVGLYAGGTMGGNGGAKGGLGIYGALDYRQSSTELTNVTHVETTIDANKALTIKTGRDATLTGTVATADQIKAAIGRNLTLTSEQDTDSYRQKQIGGQIEGRYAFGNDSGVSGSLNYSQTSSDYKSVQEQTGLNAGKGGFDISVGNHTQLNGAKIDSQASADKNQLTTDTLGHTDLKNEASYNAVSASVSFGGGGSSGVSGTGPTLPTSILPGVGVPTSESKDSTTKSAVADGSITVRSDQATGQDSTQGLSRDTANANQSLERIFDAKKVAEQQEMGRVLGEVGNRAIGDLSQALNLKDGSPEKMALHGVLGALQAGLAGGNVLAGAAAAAGTEWLGTQIADYLATQPGLQPTGDKDEDAKRESQRKVIQQWAALITGAAIGGVVGGDGSAALAGGATALDAERYNRQIHEDRKAKEKTTAKQLADKSNSKYTQAEIENALRSANNNQLGETALTGAVVPYDAKAGLGIYDSTGVILGRASDGTYVLMQNPAMLAPPSLDLQDYIKNNTGNTYSWNNTAPQLPAIPSYALPSIMNGSAQSPDYLSLQGNLYIASGGFAMNLHNGEVFGQWGLGRAYPAYTATPGVSITIGKIIGGADAASTSDFLKGGGGSASYFYPVPAAPLIGVGGGVNHSYGGATSVEAGVSVPPGAAVNPVSYGFDFKKNSSTTDVNGK